ncbi:MAG: hypothetical protein AB1792_09535 [Candidatus Zixiibacteriota bacterium]
MMRTILSDIRALAGVTGVAVVAKRDGRIEHLFPAAFTEQHTQRLVDLVTSTYQRLHGFTRLALRFERVVVHLFNQPEFLLFVTVLPDIDARQLEAFAASKLDAIARVLARPEPTPPRVAATRKPTVRGGLSSAPVDPSGDPVAILIKACNTLSDMMADSRGRIRLATDWRKAREFANQDEAALTALFIDAAGRMEIRKGQNLPASAAVIDAFARMIDCFLEGLDTARTIAEEEFYTLIEPHRAVLESAGVYLYLGTTVRAKSAR